MRSGALILLLVIQCACSSGNRHGGGGAAAAGSGSSGDAALGGRPGSAASAGTETTGGESGASGSAAEAGSAGAGSCVPKDPCADGDRCGPLDDGCENLVDCGPCPFGTACGIETPSTCSVGCILKTCASEGKNCGPMSDGCGEIVQCGFCTGDEVCGGDGVPNVCSGSAACTPETCDSLGKNCGPVADGCGGLLQCGSCTGSETCGGAGVPSVCVSRTEGCTPATCESLGKNCGPVADGCGGLLQCGTCMDPETCGGGGEPSVCGDPIARCMPASCESLGKDCGPVADGCGGLLQCGTCTDPESCGGGGESSVCGSPSGPGVCRNFCTQRATCSGGATTTIRGTVYAPNGILPLPGAFVFVPNGSTTYPHGLEEFVDGVADGACTCSVSGSPLVSTTTGVDGTFTLTNVPAGTNIPIVIQLGRWRRLVTIPDVSPCAVTTLSAGQARLPRRQDETSTMDSIPLMALSTGDVDGLECVLRKIGIEDSQFTNANGNGRIRLYRDNGAVIGDTPDYGELTGSQATLDRYDAVIFPCRGEAHDVPSEAKRRVLDVASNTNAYVNKGGRAFFTHYSYAWLYDVEPSRQLPWLSTTRSRSVQGTAWDEDISAQVNTAFPRGETFATWLGLPAVGALSATSPSRIRVADARQNLNTPVDLPITTAQEWLTTHDTRPSAALHVTFDAPWGVPPEQQCGRVLFSGFHVTSAGVNGHTSGVSFPDECDNTFTAQEKVLAYMLFDMTSCVQPPPPCTPQSCEAQGIGCGQAGDGCGGLLDCGPPCDVPGCRPRTCAEQGLACGQAGDGCGGLLDCGDCGTGCTPQTCADQGITCGPAGDGCGELLDCGECGTACTPQTCADQGITCGPAGDGCGGLLECGPACDPVPPGSCTPLTCIERCGEVPDGCGGILECPADCTLT